MSRLASLAAGVGPVTPSMTPSVSPSVQRRGNTASPNPAITQTKNTQLEHWATLDVENEAGVLKLTGLICTIGPKTNKPDVLEDLVSAGMNIARLNCSHGTYDYHGSVIKHVREASEKSGKVVCIALDTKGPEIRTGLTPDGGEFHLECNAPVTITTDEAFKEKCCAEVIYVDYTNLPNVINVGAHIYIDDGLVQLKVESVNGKNVYCKTLNAGTLSSRKGVNLPGVDVDLPAVSEKDKNDLKFGADQGVDVIFASFIRRAQDVTAVRQALGPGGKYIKVIAKIENMQGIKNFDDILASADGIMVARGDLGIEIPPQKVFIAQKMMIAKCNMIGKPVICATQMLESMTYNPRPTRAEASDVANAVLDGADCVMLSGETAKGDYPIEAASFMANLSRQAEAAVYYRHLFDEQRFLAQKPTPTTEAMASSAVNAAIEHGAHAIICLTNSGYSARFISKYRPPVPVIAVCKDEQVARQCHLYKAVFPLHVPQDEEQPDHINAVVRTEHGIAWGKAQGLLSAGDPVIGVQFLYNPSVVLMKA